MIVLLPSITLAAATGAIAIVNYQKDVYNDIDYVENNINSLPNYWDIQVVLISLKYNWSGLKYSQE